MVLGFLACLICLSLSEENLSGVSQKQVLGITSSVTLTAGRKMLNKLMAGLAVT